MCLASFTQHGAERVGVAGVAAAPSFHWVKVVTGGFSFVLWMSSLGCSHVWPLVNNVVLCIPVNIYAPSLWVIYLAMELSIPAFSISKQETVP